MTVTDKKFEKELETALRAVSEASKLCEAVGEEAQKSSIEKSDKSPVTIADFGSQALVQRTLSEVYPNACMISEEEAGVLKEEKNAPLLKRLVGHVNRIRPNTDTREVLRYIDWGKAEKNPDYFWTLDPIDGTKGFLRGDQYAIALCLIVGGELKVAALGCPRLADTGKDRKSKGAIFGAVEGQGAFELIGGEKKSIKVSHVSRNADIRMTESVEAAHSSHSDSARIAEHLGITAQPFRIDSQCKYAAVARGDGDAYLRIPRSAEYQEKIWDHAAGALVVSEAGGKITDIKGRPLDFSQGSSLKKNLGVIVTNGLIHDAVIDAMSALKIGYFE
jgi:3'(2'), 5'-bisphosphate nucleotidase